MPLDLAQVAAYRLPSPDLAAILVGQAPAHVITTIPLEPAARIAGMNPSLVQPDRDGLAGIDAEEVERAVVLAVGKLGRGKPAARKFALGVGHVLAAEDAERKHLLGRQLRSKFGIEIAAGGLRDPVAIALLHLVVDDDGFLACRPTHLCPPRRVGHRICTWCSGGRKRIGKIMRRDVVSRRPSNATEQYQDQQDDDDQPESATAIVAGPVKGAATEAAEPAEQDDDQYDQY